MDNPLTRPLPHLCHPTGGEVSEPSRRNRTTGLWLLALVIAILLLYFLFGLR